MFLTVKERLSFQSCARIVELRRSQAVNRRYLSIGLVPEPQSDTVNLKTESNDRINESRLTELMRSADENDELTKDILPVDQRLEIITLEQLEQVSEEEEDV